MTHSEHHKNEAVQGLRGVAALSVILFHWSFLFLGWAGVWVFFVISGYVITLSLIRLRNAPIATKSKLSIFYLRRAWRILPLYFAVVAAGAFILLAEAPDGSRLWELRVSFLALLTATVNFQRMSPTYEVNLLFDHFWSLSIEEHFYLMMPIVFLCFRQAGMVQFLIAWLVLSPVIRLAFKVMFGDGASGELVYQFSASHFDAFSLGVLIAVFERPIRDRRLRAQWLLCAVACVGAGWIVLTADSLSGADILDNFRRSFSVNTSGGLRTVMTYVILAYGSAALIMCILERRKWIVAPLSLRFMVYSGNLSYGLYLIHVPLQYLFNKVWGTTYLLPLAERILPFMIYMVVLYAIAHLSYRYFEGPLLRSRSPNPPIAPHKVATG